MNITKGIYTGTSDGEALMIDQAIEYVKQVVASSYFKDAILKAEFTSNNDLTNEQIYDLWMNTPLVVNVDDFSGSWKQNYIWHTEGYEAGDGFVHANRHFINDAIDMGSLIMHELAHEPLGFHHVSASELTSVPYTMNTIFYSVVKQLGFVSNDFIPA